MSDNPLQPDPAREARIHERARRLWEDDGRPVGREAEYHERAEVLIAMEKHAGAALEPNPMTQDEPIPGVAVEEAQIQENYGEFPEHLTDQGDWRHTPMTKEELHEYKEGKTQPTRGDAP
jgi:hypothetical protein